MITNGNNTVESLARIRGLVVVPRLFKTPDEGYAAWIQKEVAEPRAVKAGTIPHRILEAEGEARYYGTLLPRIIGGEYEQQLLADYREDTAGKAILESDLPGELARLAAMDDLPLALQWAAAAKRCRLLFQSGQPLYVGIYNSVERYRRVAPVLTFLGQGEYVVGSPQFHRRFRAASDQAAIETARGWFAEQREGEIRAVKKAAAGSSIPPLIGDLLGIVLERDGAVVDAVGTRVAWKNGNIHGRFGVAAPGWCYLMRCAPQTAGRLLALAQQEAQQHGLHAPLQLSLAGRVHEYLQLEKNGAGWKYAGGEIRRHPGHPGVFGVFRTGEERPFIQVAVKDQVTVVAGMKKGKTEELVQSVAPPAWELTEADRAAWGAWAGLRRLK